MYVTPLMSERIRAWNLPNLKIVAPDAGFVKGAFHYATNLGVHYANINKYRDPITGKTTMTGINGSVLGMNCVIVDDVISSGGTMDQAAELLIKEGGAESVSIAAAHGEFANNGRERLVNSPNITRILTTNSLPQYPDVLAATGMDKKIEVVSVASLLAQGIRSRMKGAERPRIFQGM
jgi:ribose-phosphate pyrophosphokinase